MRAELEFRIRCGYVRRPFRTRCHCDTFGADPTDLCRHDSREFDSSRRPFESSWITRDSNATCALTLSDNGGSCQYSGFNERLMAVLMRSPSIRWSHVERSFSVPKALSAALKLPSDARPWSWSRSERSHRCERVGSSSPALLDGEVEIGVGKRFVLQGEMPPLFRIGFKTMLAHEHLQEHPVSAGNRGH